MQIWKFNIVSEKSHFAKQLDSALCFLALGPKTALDLATLQDTVKIINHLPNFTEIS
jgi:hypothetical protein